MKQGHRWLIFGFAAFWWLVCGVLAYCGYFVRIDFLLEDFLWRFRWKVAEEGSKSRVALVLFSRKDVQHLNSGHFRWPLNRLYFARLIAELRKSGARSVGFDMLFNPDDKTSGDQDFAMAISSWPQSVVLGTELTGQLLKDGGNDDEEGYGFSSGGVVSSPVTPEFIAGSWGLGAFNFIQAIHGGEIPRVAPLFFNLNNKVFPGLALATWLSGNGMKTSDVKVSKDLLSVGEISTIPWKPIPSSPETFGADRAVSPSFVLDWERRYGVDEFQFLPMVTDPERGQRVNERRELLKDKFVLVGVGDDLLGDTIQLPNQPKRVPGVVLHAAVLDSLSQPNRFVNRLDGVPSRVFSTLASLLLSFLVLATQAKMPPLAGLVTSFFGFFLIIGIITGLFCVGIIVPWGVIPITFIGVLIGCYFYAYIIEGREKNLIKEMFGKQVSHEVVNELLSRRGEVAGARRQEISVAFLDVCGFTHFSESHSPERVLIQLNHYFSFFIPEVMKNRGMLDKIIGDALMMTTGVPLPDAEHAFQMVSIAANIRKKVEEINGNLPSGFEPFTVSCGINSGEAIVGNVGSKERMEYTVIGDTVNLAARLQGVSKSQEIVVGPRTYELTCERVLYEPLPPVTVKGKSDPIKAFKVVRIK